MILMCDVENEEGVEVVCRPLWPSVLFSYSTFFCFCQSHLLPTCKCIHTVVFVII